MSEGSLHPFGAMRPRSFPGAIKRALGRLAGRARPPAERAPAPDPALSSLAASTIEEYARAHATLFERAERLKEKAERLASSGMPSESANNRAERARREVQAGLAALRASFIESRGAGGTAGSAFDREVERLYPSLDLPGSDL
ncbi:MAG: hypothetical protein M3R38_37185 [Actinomycetota bacterium]|nr:hypothetical protein [Actinomycetota bacterium]